MTTATRDLFNQPLSHKYRGTSHYAVLAVAVIMTLAVTQLGIARLIEGPRTATITGFQMENIASARTH